ncbi:putative rna recognition domain-containing protein [Diaporthe ampelina]|uniref:Putative rna recognition domain-containing protein n=1 Tax=Diaporthe ampelina TaxID=1214573 RepID=A0A0G2HV81_9PEZI|nr:putative rna recognition domain-containing protein [Diaporthe ampelina]
MMASSLQINRLHPTFGAEIEGIDFSKPLRDEQLTEIKDTVAQVGRSISRKRDDCVHSSQLSHFLRQFGEVERLKGTPAEQSRLKSIELTDQSNLEVDGTLLDPNSMKALSNKGNELFHVDGSYNVRRTRFSLLRAYEIPPLEAGGNTEFADTRTAFSELDDSWRDELTSKDYVTRHSFWHSRKTASPEALAKLDPDRYPFSRHKLVQLHKPSGRMNLYIPSHIRNIEELSEEESAEKLAFLRKHATQEKYTLSIRWLNVGDLVIWDNTCTLHRATGLKGAFRRDMRRCGVFDDGPEAFGLNPQDEDLNFAFNKDVMLDIVRVYVRNLEERVKVDPLKDALRELFSEFGNVIDIVAKTNLKAKGQAFIVFDNPESAKQAAEEADGFDLFEKPMQVALARSRSDATVQKFGTEEEFEQHKRRRAAEKDKKKALEAEQQRLKRPAPGGEQSGRPSKAARGAGLKPTGPAAAAVVPDEYLPPNKILFVQNLPDDSDAVTLTNLFGRFEGFREVRMVPGRRGIAFVEYENEAGAIAARENLAGTQLGGKNIKVTYQRQ